MIFLIYVSSAVAPFSQAELRDLLAKSRCKNSTLGVTGILLYRRGKFMQVLEGEETVVQPLYAKIAQDPRHRRLTVLFQGPQEQREFPEWSMGFCNVDDEDTRSLSGYSDFLDTPWDGAEFAADLTRCRHLLLMFKKNT